MPGKRVTSAQYEAGVVALAASPLSPLTHEEVAKEMGVGIGTPWRARAYLDGVVEALGSPKDEKLAPAVAAVRDICLASAIRPATLEKSSTYQLVGAAEAADRIYRLASGKATSHVHILHEITSREQFARRLAHLLPDVVGRQQESKPQVVV